MIGDRDDIPTVTAKAPNEIDRSIGREVKRLRIAANLSQVVLAGRLGVSFQQLQKYEKGTDRLTVGRLAEIAATLGVPVALFFDREADPGYRHHMPGNADLEALLGSDEGRRLVEVWAGLPRVVRARLAALAEAIRTASNTAGSSG